MSLVAPVDWRPLSQLGQSFNTAFQDANRRRVLGTLGDLSNPEALTAAGAELARAGDLDTGLSLANLGRTMTQEARQRAADEQVTRMLFGGGMGGAPAAPASGGAATPAGASDRAAALMGRLQSDLGLTPVQAAGLVGNLQAESGRDLNPLARNPRDGRDGSDSIGMVQWNADRARALQQFAAQRGANPNDPNVQKDFIIAELQGSERRTLEALRAAQTPEQAAAAGVGYLRPAGWTASNPAGAMHFDRRLANTAALAGVGATAPAGASAPVQVAGAMPRPDTMPAGQGGGALQQVQAIQRALQVPGLSPQMRQQLTAQLQALGPLIAAERQAIAPTELERRAVAAGMRPGTPEFQEFMRTGGQRQDDSPTVQRIKQPDGSEVAVQWDRRQQRWVPLVAPEGGNAVPAASRLDREIENRMAIAERMGLQGDARRFYVLNGRLPTGSDGLTQDQANSGLYAARMQEADAILSDANITGVMTSPMFNILRGVPFGAGNIAMTTEMQRADQAMRNFVNAVLRRESGAVIADSEFENARRQYFPMPGDTPEVLRQKAQNRRTAIEGIARAAGPQFQQERERQGAAGQLVFPPNNPAGQAPPQGQQAPAGNAPRIISVEPVR